MSLDIKNIRKQLQDKLNLKNINQVPRLVSVIVSIWVWSLHTRKGIKDFSEIENNLRAITWQKPSMSTSKTSISNFKLREGMPSMLKTTLRWKKAYLFLEKITKVILPRVRDFNWLSEKSFDKNAGYNIGLKTYNIFPELHPDNITIDTWLQVTIKTDSTDNKQAKAFLETMWFIFQVK